MSVPNIIPVAQPSSLPHRRPELRVIEGQKGQMRKAVVPVLAAALFLFLATIVVPLIINTSMASLAYEIRDQNIEQAQIAAEIETIEGELLKVSSTDHLRQEAQRIGLVPAGPIGVISLEANTVEGGAPAQ
ncbi:hypothetical protein [Scrofimicrobium sp. R131]|uniref:Cell division protein FtsL n=1 Tax=Scrofimicrobium appendicitidis TaxID=3079930 RepID=A0AAU7V6S9_9ACTO